MIPKPRPSLVVLGSEAERQLQRDALFPEKTHPLRVPAFTRHEINTFTAGFALGVIAMSAAVCVWTYFL